ncbi:MAG TPA: FAD:protein FMN transferase, partial [Gammaproteobacteria bacterium]
MMRIFVILLAITFISACEHKAEEFHHSTLKFGTIIDITLYDVDEKLAETAFASLDQDFEYMHAAWSPWEPGSLSRMNVLIPTGAKFSVGPALLPLIQQSLILSEKTDHLFNPAIGNLINLWQMHKHEDPDIQPPDSAKIKKLVEQNPQMSDLKFDGIKMYSTNPAVQLSFGAFAKGFAIDLSMDYLKKLGVKNAIINTGGDLKAIGSRGDRPWRIGIRHPRNEGVIAGIEVKGEEGIFTSGDYERFYMYEGKRYHHILDPRTGYPAQGTQSVTVIHQDSGLADAAATALFIAGPDHWYKMAQNLGLKLVMLIDEQGRIHISPQMKQRLEFKNEQETTLIISPPL